MYVCLCNGITDRDVTRALQGGARKRREVFDFLGLPLECGKCGCMVGEMIVHHRNTEAAGTAQTGNR
ncbi:MAG: (2Fe-2S)-binding protein [Rhodospirillales bacterium]